jgi:hypothetical protein
MLRKLRKENYVADVIGVDKKTLRKWRLEPDPAKQKGPPFIRISHRCVRYAEEDIEKWLAAQPRNTKGSRPDRALAALTARRKR